MTVVRRAVKSNYGTQPHLDFNIVYGIGKSNDVGKHMQMTQQVLLHANSAWGKCSTGHFLY